MPDRPALEELADAILRTLATGQTVAIDGLGTFYPDLTHGFRVRAPTKPKVFLAYVVEDMGLAALRRSPAAGLSRWMDTHKLLPGQRWPRPSNSRFESADLVVACYSGHAVDKRGGLQAEIRYPLGCVRQVPLDESCLVPVRFDVCRVPRSMQRAWQPIDLFPDRDRGFERLASALRQEMDRRRSAP
ncbi:MAG TPA: TIR domain-containing protein [Bryobacteraceae bacterium]|nr:TIR domain-containing protein [Bryobacteraceae bacterium]